MKILYVTTVGATMSFFKDFFKELVFNGHTVELACNEREWDYSDQIKELGLKTYHIDCSRSPFSLNNIKCVRQIKQIVEENEYDIVHCHTPIAAACTRLACKDIRKKRYNTEKPLKVIYTAHGFHFYKGAPIKNWIIYYPIEWLCGHWTDILITINKEDYCFAKKKFSGLGESNSCCGCEIKYVLGVGINVNKYYNTCVGVKEKRLEIGVPEDAILILSVGELNRNKNHGIVIKTLVELLCEDKDYYYAIAGDGPLFNHLNKMADELGVSDRVKLLGYRSDCNELYKASDILIHPSLREGLPVCVMEAIAAGVPCIGSNIRGNIDLINSGNLFNPLDVKSIKRTIQNYEKNSFDISIVNKESICAVMMNIYFSSSHSEK